LGFRVQTLLFDVIIVESFGIPSTTKDYCSVSSSSPQHGATNTSVAETPLATTGGPTQFYDNPTIQYIMIGAGIGIVILVGAITLLCIAICALSVNCKSTARIFTRSMEMRHNTTSGNIRDFTLSFPLLDINAKFVLH